jgi:hypothetical protein
LGIGIRFGWCFSAVFNRKAGHSLRMIILQASQMAVLLPSWDGSALPVVVTVNDLPFSCQS